MIVCPGSGCSVEYRECSVPEGHRPCPSCGTRPCELSDEATSGCSVCESSTTDASLDSLHPCGVHPTSASGDHSLQASCSTTNVSGDSCTVTNFYACQSHTHEFPSDAPNCPRYNKPAVTSNPGPYASLPHFITCSTCNGLYWGCDEEHIERHQNRNTSPAAVGFVH